MIALIKFLLITRHAKQTGHGAARGFAHGVDFVRVNAERFRMGPQEAHGGFHINQLGGENGLAAGAVFDAGHHIPGPGKPHHFRQPDRPVHHPVRPAADPHDGGAGGMGRPVLGHDQIHFQIPPGSAVPAGYICKGYICNQRKDFSFSFHMELLSHGLFILRFSGVKGVRMRVYFSRMKCTSACRVSRTFPPIWISIRPSSITNCMS